MKKKQIILVRHAKAVERTDWTEKDFDRPLTVSGINSNRIVANYLRLIGVKPDRIVASPSERTRSTANDLAIQFWNDTVEYVHSLYNEDGDENRRAMKVHLDVVHTTPENAKTLMIVGHNSDLSLFALYLSEDTVPSMKKWSVVILSLPDDLEWKDVKPWILKFVYYLTPHFLRLEDLV